MSGNRRRLSCFMADSKGLTSIEFALISAAAVVLLSAALLSFGMTLETMVAEREGSGEVDMITTGSTASDPYGSIRTSCPSENQAPYLRWKDLVSERCAAQSREQPFPSR